MRKIIILTLTLLSASVLLSAQGQDSDIFWRPMNHFTIHGRAFDETVWNRDPFGRFTSDMKNDRLYGASQNSSGLYVKFRSDARRLYFRWEMGYKAFGDNMSKINCQGLDLYVWYEGQWEYVGTARPIGSEMPYLQSVACDYLLEGDREYMLYLPMYGAVKKLEIGVPRGRTFDASSFDSPCSGNPVIYYGSSIIQGGSTARPGLAITNRLSRMLDRTVVNLGFSGQAKLDSTIAAFMARYPSPGAYVLDNVPNCTDSLIYARQERFYRILREAHPQVPIVFVEDAQTGRHKFRKDFQETVAARNKAFKEVYKGLEASGEQNIYYVDGENLIGPGTDHTIDGSHYTDEGADCYIDKVYPVLCRALEDAGITRPGLQRHSVLELAAKEGNPRNSEGDFLLCNDGRILYAYTKFTGSKGGDHEQSVIALRESADGGETWSRTDEVVARGLADNMDNAMSTSLLRLDKKRIALFYVRKEKDASSVIGSRIMMKVSRDEGRSWGEEKDCTAGLPHGYRVVNNARVVRLASGRVLIPVSEHNYVPQFEAAGTLYCLYSDDNCRSWKKSATLEVADEEGRRVVTQEPGVVELRDGRVLMYIRTDRGRVWYAYSSDHGENWGGACPSQIESPRSPATIKRLQDGRLLLVWNDHTNKPNLAAVGARTPLSTAVSIDEGQTWTGARELEKGYDPKDESHFRYCYTSVLELEDRLLLGYCTTHGGCDSRITVLPKEWIDEPEPALEANRTLVPFTVYRKGEIPQRIWDENRFFQAAPSITVTALGRLWCCWHAGGTGEGPNNAMITVTSGDGGKTWSPVTMAVDEPGPLRILDPGAWTDPSGKVWLFFCQVYDFWDGRGGIWATHPLDPESENPEWETPHRLCDGYMKNKPLVLSGGRWIFPLEFFHREPLYATEKGRARWNGDLDEKYVHRLQDMYGSVYSSSDGGKTVRFRGRALVPEEEQDCFEPMYVERADGSLWMLCRTLSGIGESFSYDGGKTWTEVTPSCIQNPSARFYIGRLASGSLLLVKNGPVDLRTSRKDMTAYISDDDGLTWVGGLVLDPLEGVSYPDAVQDPEGFIHIVNDFDRYGAEEIHHHVVTEADIRAGKLVSAGSRLGDLVNKAGMAK